MINDTFNIKWSIVDKTGSLLWDIENIPQPTTDNVGMYLKIGSSTNLTWTYSQVITYQTGKTYDVNTLLYNQDDNKLYIVKQQFTASGNWNNDSTNVTLVSPKYQVKSVYVNKPGVIFIPLEKPNTTRDRKVRVLLDKGKQLSVDIGLTDAFFEYNQYKATFKGGLTFLKEVEYGLTLNTNNNYYESDIMNYVNYNYDKFYLL